MEKKKRAISYTKAYNGRLGDRFLLIYIFESIAAAIAVGWIFYDSILAVIICSLPIFFLNHKRLKNKKRSRDESVFINEYKEMLKNIVSGLETGFSVENAFSEAQKQQERRFGTDSVVAIELKRINASVRLHKPIEKAFLEFANRYPYEEVVSFAEIFSFGKRLGGSYVENLRKTAKKLEEKVVLKQDITTTIAEKQLELYVMCVMPIAIIIYMRLGSPGFLDPLYHNAAGVMIMSLCILVYVVAVLLGKRVVRIDV